MFNGIGPVASLQLIEEFVVTLGEEKERTEHVFLCVSDEVSVVLASAVAIISEVKYSPTSLSEWVDGNKLCVCFGAHVQLSSN